MAMNSVQRWACVASAALVAVVLSGCGTPGAPQPPTLNLPNRVTDLSAIRAGDEVSLSWTMPKKNTDKLKIKGVVIVRVCRKEGDGACLDAGQPVTMTPGEGGSFTETLPASLATGPPRAVNYFVELKNSSGRSAGLSNPVTTLAGAPPGPVRGLTAEVRKAGVVLNWMPDGDNTPVRLERKLLTPSPSKPKAGLLTAQPEPVEQNLLIDDISQGRALDKSIHFGEDYEYRAQRVSRITVDDKTLELAGELSPPVPVQARDVFPPAVPTGLAAVATTGEAGQPAARPAIDLSWQPGTESDLAGYIVYRREGDGAWQRVSPPQPVVGPAFHDAQVQAGPIYHYAVSAVDQGGHESARSAEAQESVPNP